VIGCIANELAAAIDIGIAVVSFRCEACGKAGFAVQ
jgi:hypothetical protein